MQQKCYNNWCNNNNNQQMGGCNGHVYAPTQCQAQLTPQYTHCTNHNDYAHHQQPQYGPARANQQPVPYQQVYQAHFNCQIWKMIVSGSERSSFTGGRGARALQLSRSTSNASRRLPTHSRVRSELSELERNNRTYPHQQQHDSGWYDVVAQFVTGREPFSSNANDAVTVIFCTCDIYYCVLHMRIYIQCHFKTTRCNNNERAPYV